MAGVDTFYMNLDHCSPYLWAYNTYRWCMNDPVTCNYDDGVLDRLVFHGLPLINDIISLVNTLNKDSTCMPDLDQIDQVGTVAYTMTDFMSTIIGFQGQNWDQSEKVEHLTFNEMNANTEMKKKSLGDHQEKPGQIETFLNDLFSGKAQLPDIHF